MDKETNRIIREFVKEARNILSFKYAILYGSYARKTNNENSDIDIAFVTDDNSLNTIDVSTKLFSKLWEIDTRIEPIILKESEDNSAFIDTIKSYGIILN